MSELSYILLCAATWLHHFSLKIFGRDFFNFEFGEVPVFKEKQVTVQNTVSNSAGPEEGAQ